MSKCNKCGKCCREFSIPRITFYQMGQLLKTYPFLHYSGDFIYIGTTPIPRFTCERLKKVNGSYKCASYNERPPFCKKFPEGNEERPEGCPL